MHPEMYVLPPDAKQPSEERWVEGVVIGLVKRVEETGQIFIAYPADSPGSLSSARTTVAVDKTDIGREVALLFEGGHSKKPLIIGFLRGREARPSKPLQNLHRKEHHFDMQVDGERVTISAEKEIVLKCGEASITLTRAGKILLRGTYLLSRSSGVNKVQGGSVQIN